MWSINIRMKKYTYKQLCNPDYTDLRMLVDLRELRFIDFLLDVQTLQLI